MRSRGEENFARVTIIDWRNYAIQTLLAIIMSREDFDERRQHGEELAIIRVAPRDIDAERVALIEER